MREKTLKVLIFLLFFTLPAQGKELGHNLGEEETELFNLEESLMRASDIPKKDKIAKFRTNQFMLAKGIVLSRMEEALPQVLNHVKDSPYYCRKLGTRKARGVEITPITCVFFIKENATPDKFLVFPNKEPIFFGKTGNVGGIPTLPFISLEKQISGIITFWHNSPPTCTIILTEKNQ